MSKLLRKRHEWQIQSSVEFERELKAARQRERRWLNSPAARRARERARKLVLAAAGTWDEAEWLSFNPDEDPGPGYRLFAYFLHGADGPAFVLLAPHDVAYPLTLLDSDCKTKIGSFPQRQEAEL